MMFTGSARRSSSNFSRVTMRSLKRKIVGRCAWMASSSLTKTSCVNIPRASRFRVCCRRPPAARMRRRASSTRKPARVVGTSRIEVSSMLMWTGFFSGGVWRVRKLHQRHSARALSGFVGGFFQRMGGVFLAPVMMRDCYAPPESGAYNGPHFDSLIFCLVKIRGPLIAFWRRAGTEMSSKRGTVPIVIRQRRRQRLHHWRVVLFHVAASES